MLQVDAAIQVVRPLVGAKVGGSVDSQYALLADGPSSAISDVTTQHQRHNGNSAVLDAATQVELPWAGHAPSTLHQIAPPAAEVNDHGDSSLTSATAAEAAACHVSSPSAALEASSAAEDSPAYEQPAPAPSTQYARMKYISIYTYLPGGVSYPTGADQAAASASRSP